MIRNRSVCVSNLTMKVAWLPASLREGLRSAYSPRTISSTLPVHRAILKASTKQFMTSTRLQAGIAAPEIKFLGGDSEADGEEAPFYARLVPESPSYFTAQPIFIDDLLTLQSLVRRYSSLPTVQPGEAPRVAWRSLVEYRNMVGESVKASKYHKIVELLHRLNSIHPSLTPQDVRAALNEYKKDIDPYRNDTKVIPIDNLGRALGAGKRKSSTARAWVVEGTGEVLINGKTLAEAFGRIHDRESAVWALKATDRMDKYNVWALVSGGGTTGQAEALTLAVGKALLAHEPGLKPALRRAGCVTRDPRRVERKKPGRVKARKMPTWVKR
ncbi:37S ribosomal protein S9, mitochondrial [Cadophora sp. M221]|nr:37S ribosomal protein S9, mitochondrial [Cadophora sp. M221]